MKTYTKNDGFTVEDMLHFGYGHIDAACALFNDDSAFLDSAGYLAHLGTEVLLKAWHLHLFGQFKNTHNLTTLYDELKAHDSKIDIGAKNVAFLRELDEFYSLRYPPRREGPIEVGSDMLAQFNELLASFWQLFPDEIVEIYNRISPTKKGGRILMEKKR
jgi:HEPN domain-containing protein